MIADDHDPEPTSRSTAEDPPRKIKQKRFSKRERLWAIGISVVLLLICLAWIYPFIWTISSSVKNNKEIFASLNLFNPDRPDRQLVAGLDRGQHGPVLLQLGLRHRGSIIISVTAAALMGYVLGRYRFAGRSR